MDGYADRYAGVLLGLACGDALGATVEFDPPEAIRARYPDGLREIVGGGWLKLAAGEITDDTQLTLALAASLARGGPLDMADVTERLLAWARSDPKDIGNTTRAALRLLAEGVPWTEAGDRVNRAANGRAAANGSVMRCAPVALRFRRNEAALVQASLDTSRITHADPRCTWSAVAVNQAIAHLLEGGERDGVVEAALAGITQPEVREAIERAGQLRTGEVRAGGGVIVTTQAAFWALLHHDSAEETIVGAVMLGRDADTTGAVAGALAGACYGASALPARWLDVLQPRAELERLAARLLELSGE